MPAKRPYSDLFIYYISGRVGPCDEPCDPSYIGNWQEDDTAFLFFTKPADEKIDILLSRSSDLDMIDRFHMSYTDWHGGDIQPIVTEQFEIFPPWNTGVETTGARDRILLDPGVVFGAGTHPTTLDCLTAMEMAFAEGSIGRVLDIGTGTGLLSLAAARLGARQILAVDNNFLAARTTRDNIRMNRMDRQVLSICGSAEDFIDIPADLLIANIHYDVMKQLVSSPGFVRKKWFVLSGLLRTEARKIEERINAAGATIISKWMNDGVWHTFLGTFS